MPPDKLSVHFQAEGQCEHILDTSLGTLTDIDQAAVIRELPQPELSSNSLSWPSATAQPNQTIQSILNRLDVIESFLSLDGNLSASTNPGGAQHFSELEDPTLLGLWTSINHLKNNTRKPHDNKIWAPNTIKQIFLE